MSSSPRACAADSATKICRPRIRPQDWRSSPKPFIVLLKLPIASGPMSVATEPASQVVRRSSVISALAAGESIAQKNTKSHCQRL